MWLRILALFHLGIPSAAAGHMEAVERERERVVHAAATMHNVVRELVETVRPNGAANGNGHTDREAHW